MAVYYINQLLILGLAWPLCIFRPNRKKTICYLAVTFGYMWFLATFRVNIGYDYMSYIQLFERSLDAPSLSQALSISPEPGFAALNWVLSRFISSPVTMYAVYSAMILVPVAVTIYLYSKSVWLSTWIYVVLAYFYSSMNFIRQNIACSIVLLGYKFLREKRPVPYIAVVLVGASFHRTALIMIPLYFLSQIRLTKRMGILYACATAGSFLLSGPILNLTTRFIFRDYKDSVYLQAGLPMLFLLVPSVIFLSCLALRPAWTKRDPDAEILTNMMMFSAIMWIFITKHMVLERFSHYAYQLAIIAVPAALLSLKASPEEYKRLEEINEKESALSKKSGKKSVPSKEQLSYRNSIRQKIRDHQKYYWSATAAFLLITCMYNEFGQHVNNFHNVFPYQSVFRVQSPAFIPSVQRDRLNWLGADYLLHRGNADKMASYLGDLREESAVHIFTVRNEGTARLYAPIVERMRELGLTADLLMEYGSSYLAVIQDGEVIFERVSKDLIEHEFTSGDTVFYLASGGIQGGDVSSIKINGVEACLNYRGMNITSVDSRTGHVIDTVSFDTYLDLEMRQYQDIQRLNNKIDFIRYLAAAFSQQDKLVFLSARDDASSGIDAAMQAALYELGLEQSLEGNYRCGYLAAVDAGRVVYEQLSPDLLDHTIELEDATPVRLVSAGLEHGDVSSIQIGGAEHSLNLRGINVVVYDKKEHRVTDIAGFDTHSDFSAVYG